MLPKIALIDPQLTLDLPPELTATTGLDALTQLIEPFTSPLANPLTDALCRDGIPRAARALRKVYHQPQDLEARHDMMLASLLGGLALANAKLGAVHGFAGVLGGQTGAPHGAICGSLLPHVTAANIAALAESDPHGTLERYCEVAVMLTGRTDAQPRDAVGWLEAIAAELNIPALGILGLTRDVIPAVAQQSAQASSMKGNPVVFDQAQLIQILERAL
jgi:alcohol dehydrogenase class IV